MARAMAEAKNAVPRDPSEPDEVLNAKAMAMQICGVECGKWRADSDDENAVAACDMRPCAIINNSRTECPAGLWTIAEMIERYRKTTPEPGTLEPKA